MYQDAVLKLKNEIGQSKNNSYVQVVGNFLLGHLDQHHEDAEKIMAEDKTIVKSLDKMRDEASKKKVGNCAMFTPEEGFAIVLQYFGIGSAVTISAPVAATIQKPVATPKKSEIDFNVNLEDLLI